LAQCVIDSGFLIRSRTPHSCEALPTSLKHMILISNWRTNCHYFKYDESRNIVVNRKWNFNNQTKLEYNGYGVFERLTNGKLEFFCYYNFKDNLYFQVGKSIWKIEPQKHHLTFKRLGNFTYSCEFYHNSVLLYRCEYIYLWTALFEKIDGTYDGLDFVHDHLLFRLSELLGRKENELLLQV